MMVGRNDGWKIKRVLSFCDGLFSGAMLINFQGVYSLEVTAISFVRNTVDGNE